MHELRSSLDQDVILPRCQVISRDLITIRTHIYLSRRTVAYPCATGGVDCFDSVSYCWDSEYSASGEPDEGYVTALHITEDGQCTSGGSSWTLLDVAWMQRTEDCFQPSFLISGTNT